ncbi:MAG: response regulator transcription factor [Burkholderiales bacterium]
MRSSDASHVLLIAIVDDEVFVRRAVARIVRSAGYAVASYGSGHEFLKSLESSRPACVLLDLHMPPLNGFEVQAALVDSDYRIPVLFITADHCEETVTRATDLGASACLRKPVDAEVLLEAIRTTVNPAP